LDRSEGVIRARQPETPAHRSDARGSEVVLEQWEDVPRLVCSLQYGGGRRVKDLDFGRGETIFRDTKGLRDTKDRQDRITMLPEALHRPFRDHLRLVGEQHQADLALGQGRAPLPYAPAREYPNADRDRAWQGVFPAWSHYPNRRTGLQHRHHLDESVIQKAVRQAGVRTGLAKRVTPGGGLRYPDRPGALGPLDVQITMIYTHVWNRGGRGAHSPLDRLRKPMATEQGDFGRPAGRPNTVEVN